MRRTTGQEYVAVTWASAGESAGSGWDAADHTFSTCPVEKELPWSCDCCPDRNAGPVRTSEVVGDERRLDVLVKSSDVKTWT